MNKRAVILLSGGLDSATVLAIAGSEGFDCYTMSFDYGQRHRCELEAAGRIAAALGSAKAVILRNHGPLTVGRSVEEAIGWFLMMERVAETHIKAVRARPISDAAAKEAATEIGDPASAVAAFEYAVMSTINDPSSVGR